MHQFALKIIYKIKNLAKISVVVDRNVSVVTNLVINLQKTKTYHPNQSRPNNKNNSW